jgi:DNA gyrase subunit A
MGVVFARADDADRIIAIARNGERGLAESLEAATSDPETAGAATPDGIAPEASSEIPEESTDA